CSRLVERLRGAGLRRDFDLGQHAQLLDLDQRPPRAPETCHASLRLVLGKLPTLADDARALVAHFPSLSPSASSSMRKSLAARARPATYRAAARHCSAGRSPSAISVRMPSAIRRLSLQLGVGPTHPVAVALALRQPRE